MSHNVTSQLRSASEQTKAILQALFTMPLLLLCHSCYYATLATMPLLLLCQFCSDGIVTRFDCSRLYYSTHIGKPAQSGRFFIDHNWAEGKGKAEVDQLGLQNKKWANCFKKSRGRNTPAYQLFTGLLPNSRKSRNKCVQWK